MILVPTPPKCDTTAGSAPRPGLIPSLLHEKKKGGNVVKKLASWGWPPSALRLWLVVYDESNFNAAGRMYQPHRRWDTSSARTTARGSACTTRARNAAQCHTMGGPLKLTSGPYRAPSMPTGPATRRSRVAEIILEDRDGNVISLTANDGRELLDHRPHRQQPLHRGQPWRHHRYPVCPG